MTRKSVAESGLQSALLLALALSLSGCGLILGGTTKDISVASTPTAARLTTEPLTGSFTTPSVLSLERKKAYTLVVWKEGYREEQFPIRRKMRVFPLVADIVLGLVGVVIDAATGGWWDLLPETATITLEPVQGASGLEPIEVTLSVAASAAGPVSVDAAEPVRIRLIEN